MRMHAGVIAASYLLRDTFTDVAGTLLENHTPEVGGAWAQLVGHPDWSAKITPAGRLRCDAAVGAYYNATIPGSNEYAVRATVVCLSGAAVWAGVMARYQPGSFEFYYCSHYAGLNKWYLSKYVGGVSTELGQFAQVLVVGQSYGLELRVLSTGVEVYLDGVLVISSSDTDAALAATGRAATHFETATTDSTGLHLDDFSVPRLLPGGNGPLTAVLPVDLHDNGYSTNTGNYYRSSPFARYVRTTDARSVGIQFYNDEFPSNPTAATLGVRVDGVDYAVAKATAGGNAQTLVTLPGGTKTVEIVTGQQSYSSSLTGVWLKSLQWNGESSGSTTPPPTPAARLVVYGDSLSVGADAFSGTDYAPSLKGWTVLLRGYAAETGYDSVLIEGYGARKLKDDCVDATARTAFVTQIAGYSPAALWIAVGTNDYGFASWTAASFGTAYAALLDALHAALPNLIVYAQTPTLRSSEAANGAGSTLGDYRAAIASACSGRAWVQLVDGTTLFSLSDSLDGLHPTAAGHAAYAAVARDVLAG